jgi:hypothetical protein
MGAVQNPQTDHGGFLLQLGELGRIHIVVPFPAAPLRGSVIEDTAYIIHGNHSFVKLFRET